MMSCVLDDSMMRNKPLHGFTCKQITSKQVSSSHRSMLSNLLSSMFHACRAYTVGRHVSPNLQMKEPIFSTCWEKHVMLRKLGAPFLAA